MRMPVERCCHGFGRWADPQHFARGPHAPARQLGPCLAAVRGRSWKKETLTELAQLPRALRSLPPPALSTPPLRGDSALHAPLRSQLHRLSSSELMCAASKQRGQGLFLK